MVIDLYKLFTISQWTTGERIRTLQRMLPVARDLGDDTIVGKIELALGFERGTSDLESRWAAPNRRTMYVPELVATDNETDSQLTALRDVADAQARGLAGDHPVARRSRRLLAAIFPGGVQAVTAKPYVDQAALVEHIVDRLTTELVDDVAILGLTAKVAHLVELAARYREQVNRSPGTLNYATVQAARVRGIELLCEVLAVILGVYHDSQNPDHVAGREALVTPILEQDEEHRIRSRRRRGAGTATSPIDGENSEDIDDSGETDNSEDTGAPDEEAGGI